MAERVCKSRFRRHHYAVYCLKRLSSWKVICTATTLHTWVVQAASLAHPVDAESLWYLDVWKERAIEWQFTIIYGFCWTASSFQNWNEWKQEIAWLKQLYEINSSWNYNKCQIGRTPLLYFNSTPEPTVQSCYTHGNIVERFSGLTNIGVVVTSTSIPLLQRSWIWVQLNLTGNLLWTSLKYLIYRRMYSVQLKLDQNRVCSKRPALDLRPAWRHVK
jgi:hypothetical protein